MRNFFSLVILSSFILFSCKQENKYARISGDIVLLNSNDKIVLHTPNKNKTFQVIDGKFSDTINVNGEFCKLTIGKYQEPIYLKNNYDVHLIANGQNISKSIQYHGIGNEVNNYLHQRELYTIKIYNELDKAFKLDKVSFLNYIEKIQLDLKKLILNRKNIDSKVLKSEEENIGYYTKNLKEMYKNIHHLTTFLKRGDQSPEFKNLENFAGGKSSLKDFRGNYVYIDIWATWCPPCKKEIPYLQKLEKQYQHKNIKFVSISIDDIKDKNLWKKMIQEKKMKGIQLFANNDLSFMDAYEVIGIPKFILLDTEGKIIFENAPRPSSGEMENIFKYLP